MKTPLTNAELAQARAALQATADQDNQELTDTILFEAQRDELAYSLIRQARGETPRRHLSFGDAQALATDQLRKAPADPVQPLSILPADAQEIPSDPADKPSRKKPATT